MKVLSWLLGLVVVVFVGIYVIAFTGFGNSIVGPLVEDTVKEHTKLKSKLKTFIVTSSFIEVNLELNKNNTIHIKGEYSLFSQSFDVKYYVELAELETLRPLTEKLLIGSFNTNGVAKGDVAFMDVDGTSDVALSSTKYHVELTDFNPTSIIATITNADLETLLKLVGQDAMAKAKIDVAVNFKNIAPHELDGDISLVTKEGSVNLGVMKKVLDLHLPKTNFTMKLDAKLKGDSINYVYALNSNLAKIKSSGKVTPEPLTTDIKYSLDVKELAILKPITNADIRGPLRLNGTVKGSQKNMSVKGISDFASSDTSFTMTLKELKPHALTASMKNLKLAKVLYMVKQPHYADGIFTLDVNINDLREGKLKGTIVSSIKQGLVDSKFVTKEYKFKTRMPKTTFNLSTYSELNANTIDSKINLNSSLASFTIKKARVNLEDSSIESDYVVNIPNLDKLYFVTERHLKGSLRAHGDFKQAKDLDFTMQTKVADGKIDVTLHNDDLHAQLTSLKTLQALDMLLYPEIFDASLDGDVKYNLLKKKGTFNGHLVDGKFTQNQVFVLVQKYGKVNLYKERFTGNVRANINQEKIVASLDLGSNNASIKTTNTKLNSKTQDINSKIDIMAYKQKFSLKLSGKATAPKVKIDAEDIVKEKVKQEINKKLGNFLQGLF
ncbi:hypothetical protein JHD48_02580 [Sulfurimonas sp. SAG-AH-194-I05]|nr:hypothetical protein [Sulfurimonas sp. SAG-AH-194-I05]MDF1874616.1 hypothetical protein [Sulfurimonas sp. SAG-AH-194-I05]